jgi:lipopolysaccharide transport system permease protein
MEITRREIMDRYSGHAVGAIWAIFHPLVLMGIYVFLFTFVFPSRLPVTTEIPGSFPVYILAGLVPWLTFSDSMNKSSDIILSNAGMVKQVVFPIEVLPIASVFGSFFSQLISTTALFLVIAFGESRFTEMIIFLPVLFLLQLTAMAGVSYVLSATAVFFRDIRDIVQVFTTAGLFLAPILYLPDWIEIAWPPLKSLLSLNPFSHLVWCYQDIFYFGRFEHPVSWFLIVLISGLVLQLGTGLFRKLSHMFGDAL